MAISALRHGANRQDRETPFRLLVRIAIDKQCDVTKQVSKRWIKNVVKPFRISERSDRRIAEQLRPQIPNQRRIKVHCRQKGNCRILEVALKSVKEEVLKIPPCKRGANSRNCRSRADSQIHFAPEIRTNGRTASHRMDQVALTVRLKEELIRWILDRTFGFRQKFKSTDSQTVLNLEEQCF